MKIGIYGYGNLGKGVELAATQAGDIELVGAFTKRDPETVKTLTGIKVFPAETIKEYKDKIDVLIICSGSATDLPTQTPELAKSFNVVDSFDTHAKIKEHFTNVDEAAKENATLAVIACGWDPGMFSLARLYSSAILPDGDAYTFWGRGVSQGHSQAIRHIEGVADAVQYTIPVDAAVDKVRAGESPTFTTREKHKRVCFVVLEDAYDNEAERSRIENEIKTMPNYFADYDTTVNFITSEELKTQHAGLPHGGMVIRNGRTGIGREHHHRVEFNLKLDSNPEFTGSVLVAAARAICRMKQRGETGCRTMFDLTPADMSPMNRDEILKLL